MLDAFVVGLTNVLSPEHFLYLCFGVGLGLVIGILPGLGGIAGMSLLLPFLYGMDQVSALAMLIGMIAVIPTSDTFTSVLMGIPGSSGSQATVLDGFPMSQRGEAARALSAAFGASLIGGLIGAVMLTFFILIARPIVLAFGSAELFMLTVLGLSMVGVLAGKSLSKGLAACGLGLLLGTMGGAPATGEFRLTFGISYLSDGVPLVVVGLALFALPEIVDLLRSGTAIAKGGQLGKGWIEGLLDVVRHKWLVIRCAVLGCLVGALPGLGGTVVDWVMYGHAVQTTRDNPRFGQGDVRGVLAPEASNNAKEGGGLVPTLLFGVPGSGSMAIFLGGMVLLGIEPGVRMLQFRLDLTYTIIWSLALANVIGAGACILLSKPVARLTTVPYGYLAPFMLTVIVFASYQATRHWGDILALFLLGAFAVYMRRFGWPRPAFLIGFVLARSSEAYLYQAVQFYGWTWLTRPGVMIIGALTLACLALSIRYAPKGGGGPLPAGVPRWPQLAFGLLVTTGIVMSLNDSFGRSFLGRVFPQSLGLVMLVFALYALWAIAFGRPGHPALFDSDGEERARGEVRAHSAEHFLLWFAGLLAAVWLVGFIPAIALFFLVFLHMKVRSGPAVNLLLAASAVVFLNVMGELLVVRYPAGLIERWITLPFFLR
jgi:putative tricarboxylic transport membrane protein